MRSLWLKTILLYVFPLCAFATPIQVCTTCPYTTIRDALEAATPGEVIEVADPIHTESGIIVKKDITLQGAPGTVIQAAASTAESNDRVIFVQEGSLTLRGLTIRHGKQENGGALYAAPGTIVTIEDCVFTDNEAKNYGAIDNRGQMTITRSTLSGNYGSSTNGALGNQPSGNLTLIDTRITDNSSQWFNGAVANFGTMTLERCTLARNADAMGDTGALTSSNGSMILTNCTISDNTGWAVRLISGTMTMNHVTLAQNGKGIEVKSGLTVTGSIFAENGTDMVINGGTVATNGMPNLCGDGSCPGFTIGNADLLPLTLEEDNLIHPLGDTSAAVDAYPGPCPETDQRGQARPQGTGCDLGAVEFVPSNAPPEIITASLPQATQFAPYQVTLEAMDPDGDALVFQLAEGPAGLVLDAATGMLTWVPDNQAGSHPVSVTVSDGVETVSREWLLEVTQANRPPTFTSTPNTTHLLIPAVGDAQPLIYSGYGASWQPVSFDGYVSGGSWSGPIAGDGTSITQTSNGNPGVWLSADELANGRFEGQIQVTAGSDDDYIGLVFGWQDARNFYLFDWKRGSQNEALAGMNLRRVRSNPRADTSPLPLWKTITDEPADGIANLFHNDIPWQRHTVYTVTIDFYPGEIVVEVREPTGTVAAFSVLDDSFIGGRFGFYNFSQEQTHYRGFTREITADRTWTYPLAATDADGDALTFSLLQAPAGVTLGPDHVLSWHTTTADQGEHPITVAVGDGQTVTEQSFILRVSFDHPVIQGTPDTTVAVGELYSFAPGTIDPTPGDVLTLSLDPAPSGMAVTAGLVTWTPQTTGTFPAGLHVVDAGGHVTSLHWEIEVSQPGNYRPRLTEALPAWAASGYSYLWRAEAVDADGDPLLFDLPLAPDGMAINAVTGLVSWLPQGAGERRAEIRVTDPGGLWDLRATTITLTDNTPPVFTSTPGTDAQAHRDWAYRVAATDPDGDAVSFRLIRFPKGMRIEDDQVTWHPRPDDVGTHSVIVAADDGRATTWQSFEVTVSPFANGAITITTTPPTRIRNVETYRYVPLAVDAEDDPLTWYFATAPPGMTLDAQGITWQPDATGDVAVGLRVRDDFGGLAGQTYTISVVENALPEFTSAPPPTTTVGQTYRYVAQADDEDGDPITYSLLQGPVGLTIQALSGEVVWNPAGSQIGSHALSIQADDGLGGTARQDIVITVSGPPNAPPRFTSQPQTLTARGESWEYIPTVIDPEGDPIHLTLDDAPQGLSFDGQRLSWNPLDAGSFPITLLASDGWDTTRQAFVLNVQFAGNTAPVFNSSAPTQAQAGISYAYDAEIIDPDGFPIWFDLVQSPEGMNLDRTRGIVTWTPSLAQVGTHGVTLSVADAHQATATHSWTITVTDPGDITAPDLSVYITESILQPGEIATLWLETADSGTIVTRTLTINDQEYPLDEQHRTGFSSAVSGRFEVVATATDLAGNQAIDALSFTVADPQDVTAPLISLHSPENDLTVTTPTDIVITVDDANVSEWLLEIGKTGSNCFTTIARGTGRMQEEVGGRLDVSLMPNGLYDLRLVAYDVNGAGSLITHHLSIEGNFKVGRFTMDFEDLSIPLRRIPARVNRIYDSTDKCPGDFGFGWNLADVNLQVNTVFGNYWERREEQVSIDGYPVPRYCIEGTRSHYVHITFPGGKIESFDLIPEIENGNNGNGSETCIDVVPPDRILPRFEPRPGTTSTLTAVNAADLFFRRTENELGALVWRISTSDFTPWDPDLFELKTTDGTRYLIHRTEGLRQVTDLEGNRLEINANGQFYYSALPVVGKNKNQEPDLAITYERDSDGRISAMIDPDGNRVTYAYDANGDLVSLTDRTGSSAHFGYDAFHNLVDLIDPNGDVPTRMIYDEGGRLIAQEDAYGHRMTFDHDIEGRQERVTDLEGNLWVYVYDDRGNVLSETNPLGEITRYTYDALDREVSKTMAYGTIQEVTETRTYDASGNLVAETDGEGHTISSVYDLNDLPITVTDQLGHTVTMAYDALGRPVALTDQLGAVTTVAYDFDAVRRLSILTVTDPLGQATTHEQNQFGHITATIEPDGNRTDFAYDRFGNITRETRLQTDVDGTTREWVWDRVYDANGHLITETDPEGHTTRVSYDALGRVVSETDAARNRIDIAYDAAGNPAKVSFPDGTTEIYTYGPGNNLISETDRAGRTTRFLLDALGRSIASIYPDGATERVTYDPNGRIVSFEDARGYLYAYEYDKANRQIASLDPEGHRREKQFDAAGHRIASKDPLNRFTRFHFDARGRATVKIFADGSQQTIEYDALDRIIQTADQRGNTTSFGYDVRGNLTTVTDALGQVTRYDYDQLKNRIRQTDANGHVTSWIFNSLGRQLGRELPLGQQESFHYDHEGNVTLHTDFNGNTQERGYDSVGRIVSRSNADGSNVEWTYTQAGEMETITDHRGVTRYHYDLRDRMTRVDYPEGTWVEYAYDLNGNRISVTTPYGETRYGFDALNRLETVQGPDGSVTRYGYTATGNRDYVSHGNGLWTTYIYDQLDRLVETATHDTAGNLVERYRYTLDAAGMRLTVHHHNGREVAYRYDALNRLIQEQITDPVMGDYDFVYGYDAVGNRLRRTINGVVVNYEYDANDRLLSEGGNRYTYDANGNTLNMVSQEGTIAYTYNAENRLATAIMGDRVLSFDYDASGIRVSETEDGRETTYLIDQNRIYAQVLAEIDADGFGTSYVFGSERLTKTTDIGTSHYLYDGHGSTTALANPSGEVTDSYTYDAFGNLMAKTGQTTNRYHYTGESYDERLGLYYLRARYYAPSVGRFHSMDLWPGRQAKPLTLNKYLYADANPVMGIDPSGMFTLKEVMTTLNIVGFLASTAHAMYSLYLGNYEDVARDVALSLFFGAAGKWGAKLVARLFSKACFVAGTLIATPSGLVPIEQIEVDDVVLSRDEETGAMIEARVSDTFSKEVEDLYHLTYTVDGQGRTLTTTAEHPFWVIGRGDWVAAGDLEPGEALWTADQRPAEIKSVQIERGPPSRLSKVYNFEVEGAHTYFAVPNDSERVEESLWVHNGCREFLLKFTKKNFRKNMIRLTGPTPPGHQAHHVFPVKFTNIFRKIGLENHNPWYGAWWKAGPHKGAASKYNSKWEKFLANPKNRNLDKVIEFGRSIAEDYGLEIFF